MKIKALSYFFFLQVLPILENINYCALLRNDNLFIWKILKAEGLANMEFLEERRLNDRATIVNNFNVSNNKEEGFISFSFFSERRAIKSAKTTLCHRSELVKL